MNTLWDRFKRPASAGKQRSDALLQNSRQRLYFRLALLAAVTSAVVWLFPTEKATEYSGWLEDTVSPQEVIADFTFNVRKNSEELATEREDARLSVSPVIRRRDEIGEGEMRKMEAFLAQAAVLAQSPEDSGATSALLSITDGIYPENAEILLGLSDSMAYTAKDLRETARTVLRQSYADGAIADPEEVLESRSSTGILVSRGDTAHIPLAEISDLSLVRDNLGARIRAVLAVDGQSPPTEAEIKAVYNVVDRFLSPNLVFDRVETERRRVQAVAQVAIYKRTILKGERIVDSHVILTQEDVDQIASYAGAKRQRGRQEEPWQPYVTMAGRAVVTLLVIGVCLIYIFLFHRQLSQKTSNLVLMSILVLAPLYGASYVAQSPTISDYAVPVALTSILGTILFSAEVGLVLSGVVILLGGAILGNGFAFIMVNVPVVAVPMLLMRRVRHRADFLRSMLIFPAVYVVSIAAVDSLIFVDHGRLWERVLPGAINGALVPVLALGLLPIFERLFRITTPITLLELSDLNMPLLREMALKSPGTYTHSIIIANLAEQAAEAIGADPLLSRVGAYYHDIGKMARPAHFAENQMGGRNPHDKLSPTMSALVIKDHIKEGIKIAEAYDLPQQVIDFIPQHHGTNIMTFFYHKACEEHGKEAVDRNAFRYPGPVPKTKEAGILMMADAVEAATRALRDRSPSRIKGLVHKIIRDRLDDRQFDECNLTLKDLSRIETAFLPVLAGTLHGRITYPTSDSAEGRA